ncbi:MAG: hypothetical protein ACP5D6_08555 [Kosmotogaceae bacterium]
MEDEWCIHYNDCPAVKAYEKAIIDVDWLDIYVDRTGRNVLVYNLKNHRTMDWSYFCQMAP